MKLTTHHLRAGAALLLAGILLAGCDQSSSDEKHIKVGVINGAEQDVAEVAKKVAKEKYGLDAGRRSHQARHDLSHRSVATNR